MSAIQQDAVLSRFVKVKPLYVVMCGGDSSAALLLGSALYWSGWEDGKDKRRAVFDGKKWLVKDWRSMSFETGLSRQSIRTALGKLGKLGFVQTMTRHWGKFPATWIALDEAALSAAYEAAKKKIFSVEGLFEASDEALW